MNNIRKTTVWRQVFGLVCLIGVFLMVESCSKTSDEPVMQKKKWALLFYDDADFIPAYDPMNDFAQEVASNANLDVFVLQDRNDGPAAIWQIDQNHQLIKLKDMGEIDMGDFSSVSYFIKYVKSNYASEHYILSFYDHGSGWAGACTDNTNGGMLTMHAINRGISENGRVDIVMFSAPCVMGALESVYELRACTDVYIGSENLSGYECWYGTMRFICNTLKTNPNINNIALGQSICDSTEAQMKQYYESDFNDFYTMSAIRMDKIADLASAVDALSEAFISRINTVAPNLALILPNVQNYGNGYCTDLFDLVDHYAAKESDGDTLDKINRVKSALQLAVIAEGHGSSQSGSHGLSIFFPSNCSSVPSEYSNPASHLDFAADTHWVEFMHAYLTQQGSNASCALPPPIPLGNGFIPPRQIRSGR